MFTKLAEFRELWLAADCGRYASEYSRPDISRYSFVISRSDTHTAQTAYAVTLCRVWSLCLLSRSWMRTGDCYCCALHSFILINCIDMMDVVSWNETVHNIRYSAILSVLRWVYRKCSIARTLGHITFWISLSLRLSLSSKFGVRTSDQRSAKKWSHFRWAIHWDQTSDWAIAESKAN